MKILFCPMLPSQKEHCLFKSFQASNNCLSNNNTIKANMSMEHCQDGTDGANLIYTEKNSVSALPVPKI